MLASMVAVRLPRRFALSDAGRLQTELRERHRVELPLFVLDGQLTCRVSAQIYVGMEDICRLADAVDTLTA
jgi:selenocysteine lyase/cysteine desulfurase